MKNGIASINRIPPEVLGLVPDFLDTHDRDQEVIALTHVCRTWREIFVSRSFLWAEFNCLNGDKARTYLERSNSSPINSWIDRKDDLSPHDPLLQVIPHTIYRLKTLSVVGTPGNLHDVTTCLFLRVALMWLQKPASPTPRLRIWLNLTPPRPNDWKYTTATHCTESSP